MNKDFDPLVGKDTQFNGNSAAMNGKKGSMACAESKRRKRTLREMVEIFGE